MIRSILEKSKDVIRSYSLLFWFVIKKKPKEYIVKRAFLRMHLFFREMELLKKN